jgi:uncharacterized membrane protein
MHRISKSLLTGLVTVLPAVATATVLIWLATSAERIAGYGLRLLLPDGTYVPGMGVAVGLVTVFLVGLFMNLWIVRRIFEWGEGLLFRLPLVRSVYGAFRELLQFVSRPEDARRRGRQVVMVEIGDTGLECMGLITRDDFRDLPEGVGSEDRVAVYLPMSYQIGGHTVTVPRTRVRVLDMGLDQAMRFALTAGMSWERPARGRENRGPDVTSR